MNEIDVSVILPTRDSIRYLEERIDSIRHQTLQSWEVIVVDTDSTDGTLERLRAWAAKDSRVSIRSVPLGIYRAFNEGVRLARGSYVYFATSDDTMREDALEKMVAALNAHPDCDLCDSVLREIDGSGASLSEEDAAYLPCFGHLVYPRTRVHVRRAPYDFLLHCSGKTVYTSLTQLLIRRTAFAKTGPFPEDLGPSADYLWGMRAALRCNILFLPETLATWRVHDAQQTGHNATERNYELMLRMGRGQIDELPPGTLRAVAEHLYELVELKTDLLPIKRKGTVSWIVEGVLHAFLTHPLWLAETMFFFKVARLRGRPHAAVSAYDRVFRHEFARVLARIDGGSLVTE